MAYGADTEKARTAEELAARLAGGFAHDLKNLLTPILAYGDMVRHELKDDARCREYMDEIMKAGERTLALAQRLQTLGAHRVKLRAVPILEQVQETAAAMRGENGAAITVAEGEDPGRVRADPALLDRMLRELLQNSLDATPDGRGIVLSAAIQRVGPGSANVPAGEYVLVRVKDEGAGMTPDILARVGEPYFTTKEKAPGRGLGVASVKAMVRQCEGYLQLESEPGRGTTASIYLARAAEGAS